MLLGQDARSVLALLPKGRYTLTFSAEANETKQIELVKQENEASGLKQLKLVALRESGNGRYDDLIVSEEDGNEAAGMQDRVTLLTSSRDPFLSASGYVFSTARFRNRGYDSQYNEQMLNGIEMKRPQQWLLSLVALGRSQRRHPPAGDLAVLRAHRLGLWRRRCDQQRDDTPLNVWRAASPHLLE